MKILNKIAKIFLILGLIIVIVLLIFADLATSTVLNKEYVISHFEKTSYYENIKKEIQSNFDNYIEQSGFDENVMNNIVSEEKIKNDTEIIISNIYDGTSTKIDTTEIEQNLRNNIEESLGTNNLNTTQRNAINQYVETICSQYKKVMSHTDYEKNINSIMTKLKKTLETAKKVGAGLMVFAIILLLIFDYKNIIKIGPQIGISLMSSGLLYIIANFFVNSKIKVSDILILNSAVSDVLKSIILDILNTCLKTGIVFLILGIVFIVGANLVDTLIKNKHKKAITKNEK